ncbi:MAG: arginyltransferase [Proteobacteria bacterium]|nr:arginyltransferase [Pseudomonadota bacterium]MBI3499887.1 arginyltransferase [Pseudomonadota bacterium]
MTIEAKPIVAPGTQTLPRQDPLGEPGRALDLIVLHGTMTAPCPYLSDRLERRVVIDLARAGAAGGYDALARAGFRRSHALAYRPACPSCSACVPIRVPVGRFRANRSQSRVARRNRDLAGTWCEAIATKDQYRLFRRYVEARHGDGEMVHMRLGDYRSMVEDTPVRTGLIEHRLADGTLAAVMLVDRLSDGLSAVYSYFDPDLGERSLGTYMVLDLIQRTGSLGLDHAYLGYWISESQKMAYKARFRPFEVLRGEGWQPAEPASA